MSTRKEIDQKLAYTAFLNRENNIRHHHYNEEMLQFHYLKEGDMRAVPEAVRIFSSKTMGHLSDHHIRNLKYLFVATISLVTRFAIEGGMEPETAYNLSDLYIQKMDLCETEEQITALHQEMFAHFTKQVADSRRRKVISKPVLLCLDYIYYHLYEKITVTNLGEYVHLNPKYLSSVFKKELGITVSEYIIEKRLEAARNMLKFSEYSYSEISSILAFSSQSHFISIFKKNTGLTPAQYRNKYFRTGFINTPSDSAFPTSPLR